MNGISIKIILLGISIFLVTCAVKDPAENPASGTKYTVHQVQVTYSDGSVDTLSVTTLSSSSPILFSSDSDCGADMKSNQGGFGYHLEAACVRSIKILSSQPE